MVNDTAQSPAAGPVDFFNPLDPDFRDCPYPVYRRLRDEFPVHRGLMGAWMVSRFSDCENLLRDKRLGKDFTKSKTMREFVSSFEGETPPFLRLGFGPEARSFLLVDPPVHTVQRNLIGKAFTPAAVRALATPLGAMVEEMLDGLPERFDLMEAFASPLPSRMLELMLDLPAADRELFHGWMCEMGGLLDLDFAVPPEVVAQRWHLVGEATGYLRRLVESRRAAGADGTDDTGGTDLVSELIRARHEGEALSDEDIAATCLMLMIATQKAVAGMVGNAALVLAEHPEVLQRVYEEPGIADEVLDEIARLEPPTHGAGRIATDRITVGDAVIEPGDMVVFLIGSANRDERQFERPDSFVLNRRSRNHLGFSAGAHYCLGAPLAKLLTRLVLLGWARRFSGLSVEEEHVSFTDGIGLRGPVRLEVSVRGRSA